LLANYELMLKSLPLPGLKHLLPPKLRTTLKPKPGPQPMLQPRTKQLPNLPPMLPRKPEPEAVPNAPLKPLRLLKLEPRLELPPNPELLRNLRPLPRPQPRFLLQLPVNPRPSLKLPPKQKPKPKLVPEK
jgi:hypothetical protein